METWGSLFLVHTIRPNMVVGDNEQSDKEYTKEIVIQKQNVFDIRYLDSRWG